jgi:outer membrane protein assembly factor BamB
MKNYRKFKTRMFAPLCGVLAVALACGSVIEAAEWPRFLGPSNDLQPSDPAGKALVAATSFTEDWSFPKGKGWATPIVAGDSVLVFHRVGSDEVLDSLEATTGRLKWHYEYSAPYRDRFGASDGVRSSPVVDAGSVFLFGVTGELHCVDLSTGKKQWMRDLKRDYRLKDNFFGHGSSPLVLDTKVILPLGGASGECVGAFDKSTGAQIWLAKHEWGAGYASVLPVSIRTKDSVRQFIVAFLGGETRPPTGGVVCIDALTGSVSGAVPHRARIAESVNAASPVLVGERRVLVTEGYGAGTLLVEVSDNGSLSEVWRTTKLGSQFGTPVYRDGLIFGFDGQNPRLAELVCLDAATGGERWRDDLGGKFGRGSFVNLGAAGLLALGESGALVVVNDVDAKCVVLKTSPLFDAAETWAGPAVARGRLYVSQNEISRGGVSPRVVCYRW